MSTSIVVYKGGLITLICIHVCSLIISCSSSPTCKFLSIKSAAFAVGDCFSIFFSVVSFQNPDHIYMMCVILVVSPCKINEKEIFYFNGIATIKFLVYMGDGAMANPGIV